MGDGMMKKFVMGLIVGVGIATCGAVFADEGLQKVEAYLRPTLPITLNGQAVTLESSPVVYDGSTYLKLRDIAKLTGLQVNWNDATQTVELSNGSAPVANTVTPQGGAQVSTNQVDKEQEQQLRYQKITDLNTKITELMNQQIDIDVIIAPYEQPNGKEKDSDYYDAVKKRDEIKKEIEELTIQRDAAVKENNDIVNGSVQQSQP